MARAALKSKQAKMYEKRFSEVRDFGICRVCLRRYAREGLIMGLKKASW